MHRQKVLPIIVLSQFLCTTLWFGGNAVLPDLSKALHLPATALGTVTSAVQLGFISGTLVYALLTIADRFPATTVFFASAIAASVSNAAIIFSSDFTVVLLLRFCTGFFLAGIYPVGMKIASDHFDKGLGKALGYLVGALVLGTSFPHLLKSFSVSLSWKSVLLTVSVLAVAGGLMMWMRVPQGPRKPAQKPDLALAIKVFRPRPFRAAAFGYFGHMWELYTFWAFLPVIIKTFVVKNGIEGWNTSAIAFPSIAIGAVSCVAGGYISQRIGVKKTAFGALLCSGCCCLLSPFAFSWPAYLFVLFLLLWGWMVVADSPMFSTMVAQHAGAGQKGTALTIVTCVGFFITVLSIELLNRINGNIAAEQLYLFLAPGPVLGLIALGVSKRTGSW